MERPESAGGSDWEQDDAGFLRLYHSYEPMQHSAAVHQTVHLNHEFSRATGQVLLEATRQAAQRSAQRAAQRVRTAASTAGGTAPPTDASHSRQPEVNSTQQAWVQHEQEWFHLLGTAAIDVQSVHWPPGNTGILRGMAGAEAVLYLAYAPSDAELAKFMRSAYKKACLRWHPDKLRARLAVEDHAALARSTALFGRIQKEWETYMDTADE